MYRKKTGTEYMSILSDDGVVVAEFKIRAVPNAASLAQLICDHLNGVRRMDCESCEEIRLLRQVYYDAECLVSNAVVGQGSLETSVMAYKDAFFDRIRANGGMP